MNNKRETWIYLSLSVFITLVILIVNECFHPYFFMCDDNIDSYITQYTYTIDCLKNLELPLYNFHRFMGIEFLSHGQTGLFDPVMYISYGLSNLFFGHSFALIDIMGILHLTIGGAGMFLVIKKLSGNNPAASLGAISWSLNSFVLFLGRSWFVVIPTASIFPYILLGSLYLLTKKDFKALIVSAVPKIICYLIVHHPQFYFYSVAADFIFVISYSIATNKKESLKFFGEYILSTIIAVLSSVPLWLPSFIAITSASNRQAGYDTSSMLEGKQDPVSLMLGILVPFLDDRPAVDFPDELQVRLGHIGYIFVIVILIYIATYRKHIKENKQMLLGVISSVVAMFFIFLYCGFPPFIKLQAHIPVLSNFRWIYKAMMFFHFYHIVIGSLCLTALMKSVFKKTKALAAGLLAVHVLNFGLFYYVAVPTHWGIEFDTELPFKDEAVDIIKTERYATVCFPGVIFDREKMMLLPYDYTRSLAYNLSTYYGMDNYLGYDSIIPVEFVLQKGVHLSFDYQGGIYFLKPEIIDVLRSNGVRWYLVYEGADTDNHTMTIKSLQARGIVKKHTLGNRSFYYDEQAPALINASGKPIEYSLTHNSISFKTDKDFAGGDVSILYHYHRNFKTTIDGNKASVSPTKENLGMVLNVPAGEHEVRLVYQDDVFTNTSIVVIAGYALLLISRAAIGINNRKKKAQSESK